MPSKNKLEQLELSAPQNELSGQSVTRRRLIRGAVAAPVLLVSGRSALACNPGHESCALSPMAWMSVHPNGASSTVNLSHAVGCNFLGKSPGFWTPNCGGSSKTFQAALGKTPWACCNLKAFGKLSYKNRYGQTVNKYWSPSMVLNYSGLPSVDGSARDAGWNSGAKLPFYPDRSIARILLDDNASNGILWHICAAYLNAKHFPGEYALTEVEVEALYRTRKLIPYATGTLSDSDIRAFLDQTWS